MQEFRHYFSSQEFRSCRSSDITLVVRGSEVLGVQTKVFAPKRFWRLLTDFVGTVRHGMAGRVEQGGRFVGVSCFL